MGEQETVVIDVWSDYVCPFCYLEEPVLRRLREERGERLEIRWHAYELRPEPVPTLVPDGEYLRTTWARAVYPMAERRGMTLRLPPVQPRSRLALEAAEFARDRGRFQEMHDALFRAFFERGEDLAEEEVLVGVAAEVGLPAAELRQALREGVYRERVRADRELARELGITGVPTMRVRRSSQPVEQGTAVVGAQPFEAVAAAVARHLGSDAGAA